MKKIRLLLVLLLCPALLIAGEIKVEIIGGNPQDKLDAGITRTVYARSLSKGVNLADSPNLNISLTRLGANLSLDAVLESVPPRAFHRDLTSIDQLSGALDEMLTGLYQQPPVQPIAILPAPAATVNEPPKAVNLPFKATSLTVLNGELYIASSDQIFTLSDNRPVPYWKANPTESILRLYSYQGDLLVITCRRERLTTYRLKGNTVATKWNSAVVPLGEGLITASLSLKSNFAGYIIDWGKANAVDGQPSQPALICDIFSLASADILPAEGLELACINDSGRLEVYNGKNRLWTADDKVGHLPLYVENFIEGSPNSNNTTKPVRYHLRSRLIALPDGSLLCSHSTDSFISVMQHIPRFASNAIMHYKAESGVIELNEVVNLGGNYCADLAVKDGQLLYLTVGRSRSQLKFERLP